MEWWLSTYQQTSICVRSRHNACKRFLAVWNRRKQNTPFARRTPLKTAQNRKLNASSLQTVRKYKVNVRPRNASMTMSAFNFRQLRQMKFEKQQQSTRGTVCNNNAKVSHRTLLHFLFII